MKREYYEQHRDYAGDAKPSMLRRRLDHDYTGKRMYLLTLTTEGRQPLFGEVVGNPEVSAGHADAPRILLSPLGEAVRREWYAIHDHHSEVTIMALQMMPDHLHGILYVESPIPLHLGNIIKFFKNATTRHYRRLVLGEEVVAATSSQHRGPAGSGAGGTGGSGAGETGGLAGAAGVQVGFAATMSQPAPSPQRDATRSAVLWSLGYNDHILDSQGELNRWKHYLRDNPRRLLLKRQRPDFLRPHFGVQAAGHCFDAIGNLDLLRAPQRLQVRVSRRNSPAQVQEEVQRFLAAARGGAVLVSPAISPGEKAVMRAAFDAHLPLIVLVENGFTPLTKPSGEQFDACGEGRLLLLAPWPHHNDKRKITATQCQALNLMATAICQ